MKLLILDPKTRADLIRQRRGTLAYRKDEVWDGVYVMSPDPNNEHQEVIGNLTACLIMAIQYSGLGRVLPGGNVSDREEGWTKNYRCPDVIVLLNDTTAINKKTHWLGGPDFAFEVVSQHDRSRKKFDFYAKVGTRELMIVDRLPWALELYRLNDAGTFDLVGRSTLDQPETLISLIVPLTFQLRPGADRPVITVIHPASGQSWSA